MKKIVVLMIVILFFGCKKEEIEEPVIEDCELSSYCLVTIKTQDKIMCVMYTGVNSDWYKLIGPNGQADLKMRVDSLINVRIYENIADNIPVLTSEFFYTESCTNHTITQIGDSIINN